MKKFYTGYYATARKLPSEFTLVSISGDGGRLARFGGKVYKKLAPKYEFFKIWKDNASNLSEEENNKYYTREYYKQVLDNLNPSEVADELMALGDNIVLLCYEKPPSFCHRHIVSEWFNKNSIEVSEVQIK